MKIFKWFLRALLAILLLGAVYVFTNFTKLKNGINYPAEADITSTDWYTPKALVTGNPPGINALIDSSEINKKAFNEITTYAAAGKTSSLLVMHKGQLVLEKYWGDATIQFTTNSMSMVKTIIGLLIGVAIDEGKIKSEKDLVADYIQEWKDDERNKITIEDLLLMQSGLRNESNAEDVFSDLANLYLGGNVEKTVLQIPAIKPSGEVFEYNNANTQLLAIILERATGKSIENYVSEKLWQPLENHAAGWWLDREDGMPKAFCCFFATARDWLKLGQLFLHKGNWNGTQIISESWLQKMITQSPIEKDYGYQIWLHYEEGGSRAKDRSAPFAHPTYAIRGKGNQSVDIVPNLDLIIVRIGEQPDEWDQSYLVNTISAGIDEN